MVVIRNLKCSCRIGIVVHDLVRLSAHEYKHKYQHSKSVEKKIQAPIGPVSKHRYSKIKAVLCCPSADQGLSLGCHNRG